MLLSIVCFCHILQSDVFGPSFFFFSMAFLMTDDMVLDILPVGDLIHMSTLSSLPDFIFCV